jgi:hypothetical protein
MAWAVPESSADDHRCDAVRGLFSIVFAIRRCTKPRGLLSAKDRACTSPGEPWTGGETEDKGAGAWVALAEGSVVRRGGPEG